MAAFILIHGSWQGAWAWRDMVARLEHAGHHCVAFDLPGHGCDATPLASVTLQDYADAVLRALDSLGSPAILAGHSMGGAIAQAAAEIAPDRIQAIVGVAAIFLRSGSSLMETVARMDPEYLAQIVSPPDRRSASLTPETAAKYLYPLCPQPLLTDVLPRLIAEPVAPYDAVLHTTERSESVPRYYVGCLHDRILPPALQREICSAVPCRQVFSIDADHAPFFSAPDQLAGILHTIATGS